MKITAPTVDTVHERIALRATRIQLSPRRGLRLHPLPVRIMHWINAAAMTDHDHERLEIYNDEVLFGWLHFSGAITLGTWAHMGCNGTYSACGY